MDDSALIARVLAKRDTNAYGELVKRNQSRLRSFLRALSKDHELADDLAQESFVTAWNKLHTYTGKGSFTGWLSSIAYRTFLQEKRRSTRYREILEEVSINMHERGARSADASGEQLPDLDRFLSMLNEEERGILVLSYGCGLSHREISEAMSLPIGTVKTIIHRGKERIRKHFEI